jgi:hypothetical protein
MASENRSFYFYLLLLGAAKLGGWAFSALKLFVPGVDKSK